MSLIALEEKDGDPARVTVAYERALAAFPITAEMWVRYTRFLAHKVKAGTVVDAAYARALRNCPGNGRLWANRLRAAEVRGDAAAVDATFKKAVAKGALMRPPSSPAFCLLPPAPHGSPTLTAWTAAAARSLHKRRGPAGRRTQAHLPLPAPTPRSRCARIRRRPDRGWARPNGRRPPRERPPGPPRRRRRHAQGGRRGVPGLCGPGDGGAGAWTRAPSLPARLVSLTLPCACLGEAWPSAEDVSPWSCRGCAQSYLADCEVTVGGGVAAGRAVWEEATKARHCHTPHARASRRRLCCNPTLGPLAPAHARRRRRPPQAFGNIYEAWVGYAAFERSRSSPKEARAVFRRCYARGVQFAAGGDAGEALCGAWLMFERECGSADDYLQADLKARTRVPHSR